MLELLQDGCCGFVVLVFEAWITTKQNTRGRFKYITYVVCNMSGILDRFTKETIGEKIIKMLDKNKTMRFSQIKKELGNKNDNIVSRELNNLMNLKPPLILRSEDKDYSLNRQHPELENLLMSFLIIPSNVKIYTPRIIEYPKIPGVGIQVSIATEPTPGYSKELDKFFDNPEFTHAIEDIYHALRQLKIICAAKNSNESNFEYIKNETKRPQRFDVYLCSIEKLED